MLIYIIERDELYAQTLEQHLREHFKATVKKYPSLADAEADLKEDPEIILLDYDQYPPDAISKIIDRHKSTNVIWMVKEDKIQPALDMMKYGAYDYFVKGENGYIRAQNLITNVRLMHKYHSQARTRRYIIWFMMALFILIIIFSLLMLFVFPGSF